MSNGKSKSAETISVREQVIKALDRFYDVMGHRPTETGALALMAELLCDDGATYPQIAHALRLCSKECTFPVRVPDIQKRIPGREIPQLEAESNKAWEIAQKFADEWVTKAHDEGFTFLKERQRTRKLTDPKCQVCHGSGWQQRSSGLATCACREPYTELAPKLSDRILDTVRAVGGWRIFKAEDGGKAYPFDRERFLDTYIAWSAIFRVPDKQLLNTPAQVKQLVAAKEVPSGSKPTTKSKSAVAGGAHPPKTPNISSSQTYVPPTAEQLRDRAKVQQAQLAEYLKKHPDLASRKPAS